MKLTPFILLLLVVSTRASYFGAFRGALFSVESAIGKLLNDVVSDVKSTVHCTIQAMEKVLAINGVGPEPSSNKECYGDNININLDIDTKRRNRNSYTEKDMAQEIHSSISKVNETLSHILDNTGHERINNIKKELKHESNRLAEVSLLLRKELEKISRRMKKEFPNIGLDSDKISLESVRNNMKLLYEIEKNDKNASEEIGKVLNEALDVLHINTNDYIKTDEEKINVIMKGLEQESTNNNISTNTVHRELSQSKIELSAIPNKLEHELISEDISKNIQDVATKAFKNVKDVTTQALEKVEDVATKTIKNVEQITTNAFKHKDKVIKDVTDDITHKSSSFVTSKSSSEKTHTENVVTSINTNLDSLSSFNFDTTNSDASLQEAMGIIKDGAETQKFFDNFFSKEHGTDAFEHPELLNF